MALGSFFKKAARTVGGVASAAAPFLALTGVGAPLAAGIGLAGTALSAAGRGGTPTAGGSAEEQGYQNRFRASLTGMGRRGEEADQRYYEQLMSFDPTAGFAEQTDAELAAQEEEFARTYADATGRMVGGGRLPSKSGFGLQDTQDLVRQGQRERVQIQQRNAMAAQQARAQHLDRQGSYATGAQNRYFDAVTGRMNTLEAQRLQDEADRRRGRAGLVSGVLQAGATLGGAYLANRGRREATA